MGAAPPPGSCPRPAGLPEHGLSEGPASAFSLALDLVQGEELTQKERGRHQAGARLGTSKAMNQLVEMRRQRCHSLRPGVVTRTDMVTSILAGPTRAPREAEPPRSRPPCLEGHRLWQASPWPHSWGCNVRDKKRINGAQAGSQARRRARRGLTELRRAPAFPHSAELQVCVLRTRGPTPRGSAELAQRAPRWRPR